MIELDAKQRLEYYDMVKAYGLSNSSYTTGALYQKHTGKTLPGGRACGCGNEMCDDRRSECSNSRCCACDLRDRKEVCLTCETPCAVLRELAEVIE